MLPRFSFKSYFFFIIPATEDDYYLGVCMSAIWGRGFTEIQPLEETALFATPLAIGCRFQSHREAEIACYRWQEYLKIGY